MTWDYKLPPEKADLPVTQQELVDLWKERHALMRKFNHLVDLLEAWTEKRIGDRMELQQKFLDAKHAEMQKMFDEELAECKARGIDPFGEEPA